MPPLLKLVVSSEAVALTVHPAPAVFLPSR